MHSHAAFTNWLIRGIAMNMLNCKQLAACKGTTKLYKVWTFVQDASVHLDSESVNLEDIFEYFSRMRRPHTGGCLTLFMILLLHHECLTASESKVSKSVEFELLPKVTVPVSYEIKLVPEIVEANLTHQGEVKIAVIVTNTTTNVTLHSQNLRIDENFTSLVDAKGIIHKPKNHTHVQENSFLILQFDQPITDGSYTLNLKFASNTTNSTGISMTSRDDERGEKVWTIFSGLSAHKRGIFPCWDEPDKVAFFNLSIKHSPNYTAVSSMPVRHSYLDVDGKQWTNFENTSYLWTYLVGFAVSNFDCIRDENDVINVCGAKDVLPSLKHAHDVSEKGLDFLAKYVDLMKNFTKIDLLAVPYKSRKDILPAWGMIIYREPSVTYKPFEDPVSVKADVSLTVINGMIAPLIRGLMPYFMGEHFKWTWVASGLSSYLKYYIVDKLYPDWRELDKFRVEMITNVALKVYDSNEYIPLELDYYDEPPCHKFNSESNDWGAAVFHMLSNFVSEDVFVTGTMEFMNTYHDHFITSDYLWECIQRVYRRNKQELNGDLWIKDVMTPWLEQRGYPLLNVTRDYETGKVVITQRSSVVNDTSSSWWVPINFATKSNPNFAVTTPTHWLKPREESLVIDGIDNDDWIIVNIQLTGLYRVDYDETNWKKIANYLDSENYWKIHALNRAQLMSDLYYMVRLNRQNITTFFELAKYLHREDDFIPWSQAMDIVSALRNSIFDDKIDAEISNFFVKLVEKMVKKFGFEDRSGYDWETKYKPFYDTLDNRTKKFVSIEKALEKFYKDGYKTEDFVTQRYREKVLSFACSLGHPECLNSAKSQLRANIENATENPISANIESWVKCSGAAGNEDYLLKLVTCSTDTTYLSYLGCSPDKTVLWKYVEGVLNGELSAGECQLYTALRGLIKNAYIPRDHTHLSRMVTFFVNNFERIYNFYTKRAAEGNHAANVTMYTAPLLKDYIYHIPTLQELGEINVMIRNITVGVPPAVDRYIKQQEERILWSNKMSVIVREWINGHTPSAPAAV